MTVTNINTSTDLDDPAVELALKWLELDEALDDANAYAEALRGQRDDLLAAIGDLSGKPTHKGRVGTTFNLPGFGSMEIVEGVPKRGSADWQQVHATLAKTPGLTRRAGDVTTYKPETVEAYFSPNTRKVWTAEHGDDMARMFPKLQPRIGVALLDHRGESLTLETVRRHQPARAA